MVLYNSSHTHIFAKEEVDFGHSVICDVSVLGQRRPDVLDS